MRTTVYRDALDDLDRVHLHVAFDTRRDEILDYAIVLTVDVWGRAETVRIYDGVHRRNEMHRYTRKLGKQRAAVFHHGTLGEGMRAAIDAIRCGYEEMIDGWHRG